MAKLTMEKYLKFAKAKLSEKEQIIILQRVSRFLEENMEIAVDLFNCYEKQKEDIFLVQNEF